MNELLHFAEHRLQEIALVIMAMVYTTRLLWLFHFKAGGERQAKTGLPSTSKRKGIIYSWLIIGMPWAMESTRKKFLLYFQFVIFHMGVVFAIGLSFIIPYWPQVLEIPHLTTVFQVFIGAAFVVGLMRIVRRVGSKYLRAISAPDDYFSLLLLTLWFLLAFFATPNRPTQDGAILLAYFIVTAFFLIYVPFSKISHYLYYPFTRYWFGKSMGHRGTYPMVRGAKKSKNEIRQTSGEKVSATT